MTVIHSPDPHVEVASIRLERRGHAALIAADGEVVVTERGPALVTALEEHVTSVGDHLGVEAGGTGRAIGTGWCSWYVHCHDVTEQVTLDELSLTDRHGLAVDTAHLDDGPRPGSATGWPAHERVPLTAGGPGGPGAPDHRHRPRAGIWTAPFLVGADSRLARQHPEWLVGGAEAADEHWGQRIGVLDVTHPDAAEHLGEVLRTLASWGLADHKTGFLYGGALPGSRQADVTPLQAYGLGLDLIREALGEDALLLGCGAPLLPSIGRVDAMGISP